MARVLLANPALHRDFYYVGVNRLWQRDHLAKLSLRASRRADYVGR